MGGRRARFEPRWRDALADFSDDELRTAAAVLERLPAVFEDIAASPDSFSVPQIPIWQELADELNVASQKCYLLEQTPEQALRAADARLQGKWNYFRAIQQARHQ